MIDIDLLRDLIEHLREYQSLGDVTEDQEPAEPPMDGDWDELEPSERDPLAAQLEGIIDGLEAERRAELVALMWLGRGDFEADEWNEAITEARDRGSDHTAAYLLGTPMVVDYWISACESLDLPLEESD